jgi:flagellin
MSLTLGGNSSGSLRAMAYMNTTKEKMDRSLERIASGKKLLSAADDPGGLAVAMKLDSQISNYDAQKDSVNNAKSYVESQSTALETASSIVIKMQDLKSDYDDPTASAQNKAAYEAEFQDLRKQLDSLKVETLNGTRLFNRIDGNMTVSDVTLTDLDFNSALQNDDSSGNGNQNLGDSSVTAVTLNTITNTNLTNISNSVSGLLAEAAGDESTLGFASDYLTSMSTNLATARGRIMDVDYAEESTNYATLSLQYEAAAAAVAQANTSAARVFDLIIGSIRRD